MSEPTEMSLEDLFKYVLTHLVETLEKLQDRKTAMERQTDTTWQFQQKRDRITKALEVLEGLTMQLAGIQKGWAATSRSKRRQLEHLVRMRFMQGLAVSHMWRGAVEPE